MGMEMQSKILYDPVKMLLVSMTNEYIRYRNDILESCCIPGTGEIPDPEDVEDMDIRIQKVIDILG